MAVETSAWSGLKPQQVRAQPTDFFITDMSHFKHCNDDYMANNKQLIIIMQQD